MKTKKVTTRRKIINTIMTIMWGAVTTWCVIKEAAGPAAMSALFFGVRTYRLINEDLAEDKV